MLKLERMVDQKSHKPIFGHQSLGTRCRCLHFPHCRHPQSALRKKTARSWDTRRPSSEWSGSLANGRTMGRTSSRVKRVNQAEARTRPSRPPLPRAMGSRGPASPHCRRHNQRHQPDLWCSVCRINQPRHAQAWSSRPVWPRHSHGPRPWPQQLRSVLWTSTNGQLWCG